MTRNWDHKRTQSISTNSTMKKMKRIKQTTNMPLRLLKNNLTTTSTKSTTTTTQKITLIMVKTTTRIILAMPPETKVQEVS